MVVLTALMDEFSFTLWVLSLACEHKLEQHRLEEFSNRQRQSMQLLQDNLL